MGTNQKYTSGKKKRSRAQGNNLFGDGSPLTTPYRRHSTGNISESEPPTTSSSKIMAVLLTPVSGKRFENAQKEIMKYKDKAMKYEKSTRAGQRRENRLRDAAKASQERINTLTRIHHDMSAQNTELRVQLHKTQQGLARMETELSELKKAAKDTANSITETTETGTKLARALDRILHLEKRVNRLRMQEVRSPEQRSLAFKKGLEKGEALADETTKVYIKENGVIPEYIRAMVRDLIGIGISNVHVQGALNTVARVFGVELVGTMSPRTIARIILEGGVAAEMQLVYDATIGKTITLSGDGTSDRNINYESKVMHVRVESYHGDGQTGDVPVPRILPMTSAVDHKTETQLRGWIEIIKRMYKVYNNSPMGKENPLDERKFTGYITGLHTDHAADQTKLSRMMQWWKRDTDRHLRGDRILGSLAPEALYTILNEESERKISEAGGSIIWDELTTEQQDIHNKAMYENVCLRYGEEEFDKLAEVEREEIDLFVWAGCCMHKEMNSVKGGAAQLAKYWKNSGLTPPVLLMNRDNSATAALSGDTSAAKKRAEDASQGGGIKVAALAGAIFHHKDDKKGQQDTLQIFMEDKLGYVVERFPDTSNIRYQSYCAAAAVLLVHLEIFRLFLEQVQDKKGSGTLNHMEANVQRGLNDEASLTDLCVLAIYAQIVSHPYMRKVRNKKQENVLDLGPTHDTVKAKCVDVICDPDIAMGANVDWKTATVDGEPWENPEVMYAVQRLISTGQVPNLRGALTAFFVGALETWERFAGEYAEGGVIANLSAEQRARAWMPPTNDLNEGNLGGFRGHRKKSPSRTLHQWNAITMHKRNNTAQYMLYKLGPADHRYIRAMARDIDSSGEEKRRRLEQAKFDREVAEAKRARDDVLRRKRQAVIDTLDSLEVLLDVSVLEGRFRSLKVPEIDAQIDWHRRYSDRTIAVKSKLGKKQAKFDCLIVAIKNHNLLHAAGELPDYVGLDRDVQLRREREDVPMPLISLEDGYASDDMDAELDPGYH